MAVRAMANDVGAALARKLMAGQGGGDDKPRSILRALRLASAQSAAECLHLSLAVIGAKQASRTPEHLSAAVSDKHLLLVFSAPDGMTAAVCLDAECVSAVVQKQTIGEVMAARGPMDRVFTDTDAAMVAPFVEDIFCRAPDMVDAADDHACLSGYEFVSRAEDVQALSLVLVEEAFRVLDLTIELEGGLRQGHLSFWMPVRTVPADENMTKAEDNELCLQQASGVMRAELNAVLCRLPLSVADLSDLKLGQVLPLSGARLDRVEFVTIERSRAAVGRLGQCSGLRAIRINEQAQPPVLSGSSADEFLESRSATLMPEQDIIHPNAGDIGGLTEADQPLSDALVPLETDFLIGSSDKITAEISQLAGLHHPYDEQDEKV